MKRAMLLYTMIILIGEYGRAQEGAEIATVMQQTGLYFASDNVTIDGVGFGGGLRCSWYGPFAVQGDMNVLWGNGTALSTRFSAGYQARGTWAPGAYASLSLLWGQRTEILTPSGERPAIPQWMAGIRVAPLRFEIDGGSVSALEFGGGVGPANGIGFEATVLAISVRW